MPSLPLPSGSLPVDVDRRAPALPDGHVVELPGRGTIFYRDVAGPPDAPVVLLLHGLGATADLNWHPAYEPLARHFRVIAPDHRGHGRGIRGDGRFRLADCADDVVALAGHLGIDRFTAVGYSMGGPIAQLVWQRHPGRVNGLVLCATSRDFRGHLRERLLYGWLAMLPAIPQLPVVRSAVHHGERLAVHVLGTHPHASWAVDELGRSDLPTVMQAAAALGRFTSRAWIGDVDVPTVVIVTTRDRLVPPHRQHKLARSIPGSVTFEVDANHLVIAGDAADFVHALVGACRAVSPWPAVPVPRSVTGPDETAVPRSRRQRGSRLRDRRRVPLSRPAAADGA